MKKLSLDLIEFYQTYLSFDKGILTLFAPGRACKFELSCSEYTRQMIIEKGVLKGIGLGIKRIWRCQ